MTDGHLQGHGDGMLRCHTDPDVVECIHIVLAGSSHAPDRLCLWRAPPTLVPRSTISALCPERCPAIWRWSLRLHSDAGRPVPAACASASRTEKFPRSERP